MIEPIRAELQMQLQQVLPEAKLQDQPLPGLPQLQLALLDDSYSHIAMSDDQLRYLMDCPPYWCFCWASGQVTARFLFDNRGWVTGKTVLDFGAGSGVAGIAAALAGAGRVIACDSDRSALQAARLNAALNGVQLEYLDDLADLTDSVDLVLAADVLYDRENLPLLDFLLERGRQLFLADSRIKNFQHPRLEALGSFSSTTLPDLAESREYGQVRLYCSPAEVIAG